MSSKNETADRTTLLARWEMLVGYAPPPSLPNVRLARDVRYAEQIAADPALARLDKQVNRQLKQLARQTLPQRPAILPGTRLLRDWGGKTHEVTVTDLGFVYQGTTYNSLTAIARNITGSGWSGPKFFGLK